MKNYQEMDREYIAHTYGRFPVNLVSGEGEILRDDAGREYIDLCSGIGVTSFGNGDAKWKAAVEEQLDRLQHVSNLYYTDPCIELAKMLCEKTGMSKVFFGNSGAEANECAIKVARKYGAERRGIAEPKIITMKNSFHGRTITTLAATGQDHYHKDFQPLTPGFCYANANDTEGVLAMMEEPDVVAVMMESIQGEGGVIDLEEDFVRAVSERAAQKDILTIFDEVQTGNGRTGKLYGYMHFGIRPDIVTTAKGLGGGLPIGAALLGEKVADVLVPGDHGSTFGGNPICCAGAISILGRLDDDFLREVERKGKMIRKRLSGIPGVEGISGKGLMVGIKTSRAAKDVVAACLADGVLALTAHDKVRLLPPLNITDENLAKALDILARHIASE